jgi:C4-dicarboxylate-specific signal transduction histidine kinase
MPVFLGRLSEVQIWAHQAVAAGTPSNEQWVRFEVSRSELQSVVEQVKGNLASAYRGNQDGSLNQIVYVAFTEMMSRTDAFLQSVASGVSEEPNGRTAAGFDPLFGGVAESAVAAWATAQSELDRLLHTRIRRLIDRMGLSLALTGVLVGLSIVVSVLTHRHIVEPLERLEKLASEVRRTRDYSLRLDYTAKSEIGQLTAAFNEMLAEVAAAHERERAEHAELARASRLTTMGAMAASIAHEINQPLQAISANSSAAQRWLSRKEPDIDEARSALKSVASDAHRASQVIESVRSIVKKRSREKEQVAINDVVTDILKLVHGEIRKHHITVRTNLLQKLPPVVADRTQLQQVLVNLIMNAVDAMKSGSGQKPVLTLRSNLDDPENVTVTVEDSGSGIDPENLERIFDPFFSTKSEGMGLGLAICRSIIVAHGGRLWATSKAGRGATFHLTLPIGEA